MFTPGTKVAYMSRDTLLPYHGVVCSLDEAIQRCGMTVVLEAPKNVVWAYWNSESRPRYVEVELVYLSKGLVLR